MIDRLLALVLDQVLLADVGDVALLGILREQMVEGLVLRRTDRLGDGLIPFIAVREDRVDVEDHPAEIEQAVAHDVADAEAGLGHGRKGGRGVHGRETFNMRHGCNLGSRAARDKALGNHEMRC